MQCSEKEHYTWPHSFNALVLAYANRYPNPLSRHILTQDVLSCTYDQETNTLHTKKLILKSGKLPRWAPKGIIARAETWVVEDAVVDVLHGTASYMTRNIDHLNVLEVEELMHFQALSSTETTSQVSAATTSAIAGNYTFGSILASRIAKYGISSFKRNLHRSRSSLSLTLSFLSHPTYRPALLHPNLHGDYNLPDPKDKPALFIDRTNLVSGFQNWEIIGSGFSGHGLTTIDETHYPSPPPPDLLARRSRPSFLQLGDWAWWKSRWRPQSELTLFPEQEERQPMGKRMRVWVWDMLARRGWVKVKEERKDQEQCK